MDEKTMGPVPAALPQTELLYRAYRASEALGAHPSDIALENYNRLMGEVERRCMSVETRVGTLEAEVVELDGSEYPGIQVSLRKPDGTGGIVSWTEVGPAETYGERNAHTFAYDGRGEEPVTVDCDVDGPWMRDPAGARRPHAPEAPDRDDWIARNIPVARFGDDALVFRPRAKAGRYVVAHGYDPETGHWQTGTYRSSLVRAAAELEGLAVYDPSVEGVYDLTETLDPSSLTNAEQLEWILLDNGFGDDVPASVRRAIYERASDDLSLALWNESAEMLDDAVKEHAEQLIGAERRLAASGVDLVTVAQSFDLEPEEGRAIAAVLEDGEVYLRRPGTELPELHGSVSEALAAVRPVAPTHAGLMEAVGRARASEGGRAPEENVKP